MDISKSIEKYSPIRTEEMDTIMDVTIIARGEFEKTLAIAGGMINSDVIRSTPTIWTETETAKAIKNINRRS